MTEQQTPVAPEDRAGQALAGATSPDDRAPVDPQAAARPGARGFAPPAEPSLKVGVIGNCA